MRKTRISLDLSIETKNILENLSKEMETTQSNVLRKALSFYNEIRIRRASGEKLAILKNDKPVELIFVNL